MWLSKDINAVSRAPDDDFWYTNTGIVSNAGVRVSNDSAMRLSAVYACVRVLSETVAQLPLFLFQRLPDDIKQRAVNNPLYKVLHQSPNEWQTSYEWREMMQGHLSLRGNAYSEIIENGQIVTALIPLHPDRVKIDIFTDGSGLYRFRYTNRDGSERIIARENMFHLRGFSYDGIAGINPIEQERESVGLGLAAQDYGARFFANDGTPGGWIEYPGHFKSKDDRDAFAEAWRNNQVGRNRHKLAVLEHGMEYKQVQLKNKDAQFIESRKYQDTDIARIFRVPPHKIGILDRATFSNIEQQSIEFVTDTMMPHLVRWEQAITRDLITLDDEFYAEFLVDGLLRGDSAARSTAYQIGINTGYLTRNEARRLENMNPLPGLDEPLTPMNMQEGSGNDAIKRSAAARIVSIEVLAMNKAYKETITKRDPDHFKNAIEQFFNIKHAYRISEMLAIDLDAAKRCVSESKKELIAAWQEEIETSEQRISLVIESWQETKAQYLSEIT